MTMLEDMQDARNAAKPAKDTFCTWNEVELRARMEKDAQAVNKANKHRLKYDIGGTGSWVSTGTHVACKNAMRDFGGPCTRGELQDALGVVESTVRRYMNALIRKNEVTTDRNDAGEVVYVLAAGYSQKELDL